MRIRGVTYPSISAAARAHSISVSAVFQAKRYNYLDRVGLYPMKASAIIALASTCTSLTTIQHEANKWLMYRGKKVI